MPPGTTLPLVLIIIPQGKENLLIPLPQKGFFNKPIYPPSECRAMKLGPHSELREMTETREMENRERETRDRKRENRENKV